MVKNKVNKKHLSQPVYKTRKQKKGRCYSFGFLAGDY